MKNIKKYVLIVSILAMIGFWSFIALERETGLFKVLDLFILVLIIGFSIYVLLNTLKKSKEQTKGIPLEDELSTHLKYKSGYYAYMASMYMWLFIFIVKDKFPNIETLVGGGILLSALIFAISKYLIKKKFLE